MNTMVNGKEIKVFGRNDISVVFTQKVNEMLNQGFVFWFESGTQGEEGKVCLTNDGGKTVYVFYVHNEYESLDDSGSTDRVIYITGEKFIKKYPNETLWLGKGEKLYEVKWFCIDERKDVCVETIEEFKEIDEITSARRKLYWEMRDKRNEGNEGNEGIEVNENVYKIAISILNKRNGYKSLKVRHITKIMKRDGKYYVYFEKSGNTHCVLL